MARALMSAVLTSRGQHIDCDVRWEHLEHWFVIELPDGAGEVRVSCELVASIATKGCS